jgi:hypothetical protein
MTRVPRRFAGIGAADLLDAAAFDAYVGPSREVVVDHVRGIIALQDGVTAGGKRPIMSSQFGANNGVATLDAGGDVPAAQLGNAMGKTGDTVTGRYLFQTAGGTGAAPQPMMDIEISEAYTAGSGFFILSAILATRTGGTGHREALHVEQKSSAAATGEFIVGIQGQGRITAGSGSAFGLNGYVWVDVGSNAAAEAGAAEFNTDIRAQITRKVGVQIVDVSTSTQGGTAIDAGMWMGKQSGAKGYSAGIYFGDASRFPVFAGGTLIYANGTGAVALRAGVDFTGMPAFTEGAFIAPANSKGYLFGAAGAGGLISSVVATNGGRIAFGTNSILLRTAADAEIGRFEATQTYLMFTDGTSSYLRRVIVNAADSGGSGYRSIKVEN